MNKFYTILVCSVLAACAGTGNTQTHFVAQQKGEKQMATLILDEQFTGNTRAYYEDRGWYDGTGNIGSTYLFEQDATLGKQVIYNHYPSASSPNMTASALRHAITPTQTGISIHVAVKFHNVLQVAGNCHEFYFGQGMGEYTAPSGSHIVYFEPKRLGANEQNWEGGWFSGGLPRNWGFDFYNPAEVAAANTAYNNSLSDDVWYEIRAYLRQSSGGQANGTVRFDIKRHDASTWTTYYNRSDVRLANVTRPAFNQFIFGPYVHSGHVADQRFYVGWIRLYSGDAITDGNIPGGVDGGGGNGGADTNPPVITDKNVTTTSSSAEITWSTDENSNSAVDFGPTPNRGTLIVDDTLTKKHAVKLNNLAENTTYYYRFSSRDAVGNTTMDPANSTFTTKAADNGGGVEPGPAEISLEDLTDVTLTNPEEGQVLMYRGGKWVNVDARPLVAQLVEEILGETSLVVNKPSA